MNFYIKILIFYFLITFLVILYKELPFSKITLRRLFPYFAIIIFLLSLYPFYLYFQGLKSCEIRCITLGGISIKKEIILLPLISITSFISLFLIYIFRERKYRIEKLIYIGKNSEGISVKGVLKPFIFIDKNIWKKLNKKERKIVLLHEINHIRNRDTLFKLIFSLLSKTFFYLPFFFLLEKSFEEISELSADEFALKKTKERNLILKTIAKVSLILNSSPLLSFASSPLLKRIELIENRKRNGFYNVLFILLIIITGFLFISFIPKSGSCQVQCQMANDLCKI